MLAVLGVYAPHLWSRWQRHSNALLVAACAVLALALWLFDDRTGLLANSLGWPVLSLAFGMFVFAAADRVSVIGRYRVPGAGWVAAISYSLYLSHKLAMHAVQAALATMAAMPPSIVFVCHAVAILLVGATLHSLVERPFLRWRDRLAPSRATAAAAA